MFFLSFFFVLFFLIFSSLTIFVKSAIMFRHAEIIFKFPISFLAFSNGKLKFIFITILNEGWLNGCEVFYFLFNTSMKGKTAIISFCGNKD